MAPSRVLGGVAALALALVISGSAAGTGPLSSGLQGVVRRGPTTPVCAIGKPCSTPVKTTLIFTRLGRRFTVPTGTYGGYRALLAPGVYSVTTSPKIGFGNLTPARVKVRLGHVDHLDFTADTGIR